jgi:DNA (cytosine-5)-methyltransferase 1
MQGLPEGLVTGVPGLSRREQLAALGNGVVPHQVALALHLLMPEAVMVYADGLTPACR